jgi:tetratricopeptide (TPR) repeat protein
MSENASTEALGAKENGLRLFEEGMYEEAAEQFGHAQELFAIAGQELEAAEMLNNLGVVFRLMQNWDQAQASLEEARAAFQRLGDRSREAQALGNLGALLSRQGDQLKAQEYLRDAAGIFGELGDTQRQGETLMALGLQLWKSGDRRGGLAAYQGGLVTLEKPSLQQKILRGLLSLVNRLIMRGV